MYTPILCDAQPDGQTSLCDDISHTAQWEIGSTLGMACAFLRHENGTLVLDEKEEIKHEFLCLTLQ